MIVLNISSIGNTGFGIDFSNVSISSNNLGNHKRSITSLYVNHIFSLINAI